MSCAATTFFQFFSSDSHLVAAHCRRARGKQLRRAYRVGAVRGALTDINRAHKIIYRCAAGSRRSTMSSTVKYWETALSILLSLPVSFALADDIKTNNGKEYKNAIVSRVEPDGIMIKFSGGLVKIPFTDLSEELKQ